MTVQNFTLLPTADIAYLSQKTYPSAHFSFDPQTKEWSIVDDVDEDDPEKKVEVPWIEPNVDNPIHYKKFPDLKYTSPLHVRVKVQTSSKNIQIKKKFRKERSCTCPV